MSSTPIERPGVTIKKSLAEVLDLNEESETVLEWQRTIADLDANQACALRDATQVYVGALKEQASFHYGTVADAFAAGWAARGHESADNHSQETPS